MKKNKIMEKAVTFKNNIMLTIAAFYLICAIFYASLPSHNPAITGFTTFVGESGMDILIFISCILLYCKVCKKDRRLVAITGFAFFCEAFADGSYNLIQNMLNISNPSILMASSYEIPFLLFLSLETWLWWGLVSKSMAKKDKKIISIFTYTPFITSSFLAVAIFIYFADWKIKRFSSEGLYQLADIFVEATSFALLSTCLSISRNKSYSCIAIGFLIIIFSNYMIRLPVLSLATTQNNPFEFTWILGQLFI